MARYKRLILTFDGASRNSRQAGCGWTLFSNNKRVARGSHFLGSNVNSSQAEYEGLIEGLKYMKEKDISAHSLLIRGDAKHIIGQLEGSCRVRSQSISSYYDNAKNLIKDVDASVNLSHIPRANNKEAHRLANEGMNQVAGVSRFG